MAYQIYLVEDHPIMREAYAGLFAREDDLTLCGVSDSAEGAMPHVTTGSCDLLITDLSLPGIDGIEFTRQIRASQPDLPILIISIHDEPLYVGLAHAAGATAYLSKEHLRGLAAAVRSVLHEGSAAWHAEASLPLSPDT